MPHSLLLLVLTPLPSIVIPLLFEFLPLRDPSLGWRHNEAFLVRTWLRTVLTAFSIDTLVELYIPELRMPLRWRLLMNALQAGSLIAWASGAGAAPPPIVGVAEVARVFPVPFAQATTLPVVAGASWALRFSFDSFLADRSNPHATDRVRRDLRKLMRLVNFRLVFIYAYSLFGALFVQVPAEYQPLTTVVLAALKIVVTRGEWRRAHVSADADDDLATAQVAFGARFLHATFTCTCLQKSKSVATMVALVAWSVALDLLAIRALHDRSTRVAQEKQACETDPSTSEPCLRLPCLTTRLRRVSSTGEAAEHACRVELMLSRPSSSHVFRAAQDSTPIAGECTHAASNEPLHAHEVAYLQALTNVVHRREATLLRFYVELFVPAIFVGFISAMLSLSNGKFMPFLYTADLSDLRWRIVVQLAAKAATFALLLRSHPADDDDSTVGGLRQLAFVVRHMNSVAQIKCLLNTLWILDFPLIHNGNDLRFQFEWLRGARDLAESTTTR